jgi:single-strand DNA-binding protein
MSKYIARNAIVATTPRHLVTFEGLPITSFRVAESVRSYKAGVADGNAHTNWFTIMVFGDLAVEVKDALTKGARIDAEGNIVMRDWDNGDRSGTSVEIELESYKILSQQGIPEHNCNCKRCPE